MGLTVFHNPIGAFRRKADYNHETIKKLVETNGNKQRAAISLGYSQKHINRMINSYKEHGKDFFVHGNKGRTPAHALASSSKNLILDLYRNKYWDANFEHFKELLAKHEDIHMSTNALRKILNVKRTPFGLTKGVLFTAFFS